MLTLYHSPFSRSTRMLSLLHELGIQDQVQIRLTDILRVDGTGQSDPVNPHPDGKVPALLDGETLITETNAIMLYLTDMFPEAGLGASVGDPQRGTYLSWLAWYGNMMEPAYVVLASGADHPIFYSTFRDADAVIARLEAALAGGRPYLMGDRYTAVDLLVQSPFGYFPEALPDTPALQDWFKRCGARPSMAWAAEQDQAAMAPS
ncbi:glutathione S-transferase family protein [Pseudooceanicola sp. HF7]|uniref:glutathione S-transferase family protein n=1 Tax=Pseudooceanicola sp. HF7 TaxID=2721560 RepID=UPI00142FBC7A|nr:glutathione S-transferase family protein [Pseudooceanicola sp. HF7]NIZ10423.1 glutathione S-transferase family protein [Pseudooceanicola sp. HF7]